jgi:hypothetical protein
MRRGLFSAIFVVYSFCLPVLLSATNLYWQKESPVFKNRYHPGTSYYFDDPDNLFYGNPPRQKSRKSWFAFLSRGTGVLRFFDHRYKDDSFAGLDSSLRGHGFGGELMFRGDQALFHSFYFDKFNSKSRLSYAFSQDSVSVYGLGYKLNISLYDNSEEGSRHYLKSLINGSFYLKAGLEMADSRAPGTDTSMAPAYGAGFEWGTEFGLFTEYLRHEVAPIKSEALKMGIALRFP